MRKVTYLQNPTDDVVRLMIYKSDDGVYVFGFDDLSDSSSKWDNLYLDLEDANQFCQEVYNVGYNKWITIEDPQTNCQHDWIGRTRIKGKENGTPQWGQFEQLKNGRWTEIIKNEKLNSFHGMSGNERLRSSGLFDEFEKSLKTDKVNAEKILRALQWDEHTLKNILQ